MEKRRIPVLVCAKYGKQTPYQDDAYLCERLKEAGCDADITVWDDERIDYSDYDLAIIRSCWDYDMRVEEFLDKMKQISQKTHLVNSYKLIENNSDKRYLKELQDRGIRIIPTIIAEQPKEIKIPSLWKKVVVKPTVSASGKDTYLCEGKEFEKIKEICEVLYQKNKIPMLQQYFSSVETFGEHSSVVIDGQITFTMKKIPAKDSFLVHQYLGGSYIPVETSQEEVEFVKDLLQKLKQKPIYMRVDYLKGYEGRFYLLELEQIEPNLYLCRNEEGTKRLIRALLELL